MASLQGKPTEMTNTNDYSGSDTPPDDKPYWPRGFWESLTTVVGSVSWQLLYASNEVIGYKLLLAFQKDSYQLQPFSWMPVVATVVVGWLTRSDWNPEAPMFNQLDEQATNQQHELQIITLMDKPGDSYSQAMGTWGNGQSFDMYSSFAGRSHYSFGNDQRGYYGDDPGWPIPYKHSFGKNCYEQPCCLQQGRCIFALPPPVYTDHHGDACLCHSTLDSSIACSFNKHPQTDGREPDSHSANIDFVEPETILQEADSITQTQGRSPPAKKKKYSHTVVTHQAKAERTYKYQCDHQDCPYQTDLSANLKQHKKTHQANEEKE